MPTFMWTLVEWYGIVVVAMLSGLGALIQAVQTLDFAGMSVVYESEYQHWYDIIVAGILM